jgi:hypothetical protein
LVKSFCVSEHPRHINYLANIPTANILVKGICATKHQTNMDNTLRGWAKLDTATGETAIQNNVTWDIKNYTDATKMSSVAPPVSVSLPSRPCSVVFVLSVSALLPPCIVLLPSKTPPLIVQP